MIHPWSDSANMFWQCSISSPLSAQSFTPFGFESSYCCTTGYLQSSGGLWAADLRSGFWSLFVFCQGSPQLSSVCPALQLLLTSLRDDSLRQSRHRNTVLNLLNIFALIYALLPHVERLPHAQAICRHTVTEELEKEVKCPHIKTLLMLTNLE